MAETRAVNRALRKAYGIGICSVEAIGAFSGPRASEDNHRKRPPQPENGNGPNDQHLLRDRLCQLIRQHDLDPVLVKSYAIDYCGVKALREASREQVENFIGHVADWATKDKKQLSGAEGRCCLRRRSPACTRPLSLLKSRMASTWFVSIGPSTWHAQKPYYAVQFAVLEPKPFAGRKAGQVARIGKAHIHEARRLIGSFVNVAHWNH